MGDEYSFSFEGLAPAQIGGSHFLLDNRHLNILKYHLSSFCCFRFSIYCLTPNNNSVIVFGVLPVKDSFFFSIGKNHVPYVTRHRMACCLSPLLVDKRNSPHHRRQIKANLFSAHKCTPILAVLSHISSCQ